ncbi:palmitoyltransferase ZDHHC23-B-like [Hetaerina americana]|uniref:palmitoyltransferase ZDHHC23-B-like n=1 Tax=Hetaerina americana TaxID=62018 RepID=UPI003A7F3EE6
MSNSDVENSPLCCCEYLNLKQERSHLLGFCCDCQELDENVERLISGRPNQNRHSVCSVIKDRLRIPWVGGAKQVSWDEVSPIFIEPALAYIAALNVWCSLVVFTVMPIVMFYLYRSFLKSIPQTRFFVMWSVTSAVLLLAVFELKVVPLLEILPSENYKFFSLLCISFFFVYKVKTKSSSIQNNVDIAINSPWSDFVDIECSICRRNVPPRAYHCKVCQTCILKMDHHCVWINCCIGERNHAFFLMAIIFLVSALVYGSNLTLTTVCQPFLFMNVILLPEDCSDVYHEFDIAVCFVGAVYCLLTAVLLTMMFFRQCWLISLGITSREWWIYRQREKKLCCFFVKHSYNNGFLKNWTDFCLSCSK